MKEADQKRAATAFVKRWQDRGNERQDSQTFWLDLLETVYDIPNPGGSGANSLGVCLLPSC